MGQSATLQQIFNDILAGETKKVLFFDKKEYDSTRTSLLRKFREYLALIEKLGSDNPYDGKFLRCSWNSELGEGTFLLDDERRKSNLPGKTYQVSEL